MKRNFLVYVTRSHNRHKFRAIFTRRKKNIKFFIKAYHQLRIEWYLDADFVNNQLLCILQPTKKMSPKNSSILNQNLSKRHCVCNGLILFSNRRTRGRWKSIQLVSIQANRTAKNNIILLFNRPYPWSFYIRQILWSNMIKNSVN